MLVGLSASEHPHILRDITDEYKWYDLEKRVKGLAYFAVKSGNIFIWTS